MGALAFVLKGYPRLSETFVSREIAALEARGFDIRIFSLRRPTDVRVHRLHDRIRAPVVYLPEYLHREPFRVLGGIASAIRRPGFLRALATWLGDLARDPTRNRIRRFGQGLVLARELPGGIAHLHAHFLHTPSSVARYASLVTGLPWSASAHAKDIWTSPDWELDEKLAGCAWAVTCTAAAYEHLARVSGAGGDRGRLEMIYHGIDLAEFPPGPDGARGADGSDPADPVVVLSVGRAVDKKGFDDLIDALARLSDTLHWRFEHAGAGPLLEPLRRRAERAGIATRIRWHGALTQDELLARYRTADVFVLASRIAGDGDRDGLPNVLLEAQSQGLPCLATRVSAIPELIQDGRTGVLVPPGDVAALAAAMEGLIADPPRRGRLGRAGRERTRTEFTQERGISRLADRFRSALDTGTASAAAPGSRPRELRDVSR